ncbi:MAG: amidohydrolase [Firmicutes bacterium]|nr:amidohydrolase [Bacillota bacterium]
MKRIFYNGIVRTVDERRPVAEAVAVQDGIIMAVGSDDDVAAWAAGGQSRATAGSADAASDVEWIDLEGKLMVPGFHDSHLHLLSYGLSLEKVNLGQAKSIDDIVTEGRAFLKARLVEFDGPQGVPAGWWLQGRGWNNDYWEDSRFPNRYDLDRITTEYPVTYTRACGHIIVVNTKALEIMGVTRETPQIAGGRIDLDEDGEPLGIFREAARDLVYNAIPRLSVEDIKRLLVKGAIPMVRCGITAIQSDDLEAVPEADYQRVIDAMTQLDSEGKLPLRVFEQCLLPPVARFREFIAKGYRTDKRGSGVEGNGRFRIGPLKLLADGSLGGRTAFLSGPYADDPQTCGIPVFTQEELDELVKEAHDHDMIMAIHCIGDGTMRMAFESIEKAQKDNPKLDMRHGLVHCQITDEGLLKKFRDLNVVAHVQPIFIDYDMHIVRDRVGEAMEKTSYNWKTMLDLGVHVAGGSDSPVESFHVLNNLYCAVTRRGLDGQPEEGWLPDQKMSLEEALYIFTMGGAYASYDERVNGSITVGKQADFAVIDRNIFDLDPEEIKKADVVMTVIDGEIAYRK